jgi:hypothetical protein
MKFHHRDGEDAAGQAYGTARPRTYVNDDGTFEVDDPDEGQVESLVEFGHEPVTAADESAAETESNDDKTDDEDEGDDQDALKASDYTETELVEMGYRDLQSIATHYDDVDGSASADALTEALIEKRREETEAE